MVGTCCFTPSLNLFKNKKLGEKTMNLPPAPKPQIELFRVEKQATIDGVEMGVLENGVPYLTESGLARMCGINRKTLNELAVNWKKEQGKPRGKFISDILISQGYEENSLFLKSTHNGTEVNAYTELVCMAILEHYAFNDKREQAVFAFRTLARQSFRAFIYAAVGYNPEQNKLDAWKQFHDRVSLTYNSVPSGFFCVFKEIADMIVHLGQNGLYLNSGFVPDLSVGRHWSRHWEEFGLDLIHGERAKFKHNYPDYFPQAASNPQEPWCYPESALGEFRRWIREDYVGKGRFETYIAPKFKAARISFDTAKAAIENYKNSSPPALK